MGCPHAYPGLCYGCLEVRLAEETAAKARAIVERDVARMQRDDFADIADKADHRLALVRAALERIRDSGCACACPAIAAEALR